MICEILVKTNVLVATCFPGLISRRLCMGFNEPGENFNQTSMFLVSYLNIYALPECTV